MRVLCLKVSSVCALFYFIYRAFISIWKENILKIWNRKKGIYVSYSSPRVTVSHTLMIHMEFICLFMLSFIWGRVARKKAVYRIFPQNTSGFWRKKKRDALSIIIFSRSNHYIIIHINSVSYSSLTLIGPSSFSPFCSKRMEDCSVLFERKKGLSSDEII